MPRKQAAETMQADGMPAGSLFDTERPGGAHERIYRSLVHAIVSGRFSTRDKLPAESELATTFSVSRPVVRQALERLRSEGVIKSHRGSGNYVVGLDHLLDSIDGSEAAWGRHARMMLDDLEFRLTIEPEAACLAARRRTEQDLDRMRSALTRFEHAHAEGRITHHFDYLFHEAIAISTSNERFVEAARSLEYANDAQSLLLRHLVYFHPSHQGAAFIREHQRVFDLIEARQADAAREAMRNHILASLSRFSERFRLFQGAPRLAG